MVRIIRKQLIKRALDMMTDLMGKGEEEYEKFWSQFGRNIKLGVVDDPENKDRLASLLRVRLPSCHPRLSCEHPCSSCAIKWPGAQAAAPAFGRAASRLRLRRLRIADIPVVAK